MLCIDVETAEGKRNKETKKNDPALCYDIGGAIVDRLGNIYEEFSFVVEDIFYNSDIMSSAYYASKIPQYCLEIEEGKRKVVSFLEIRSYIRNLIEHYNVSKFYAYNAEFDFNALNDTLRYISKSAERWFFEKEEVEINDIWHMACQTLFRKKAYFDFCEKHNLIPETGNPKTNAESAWRFITNNPNFIEDHTGLEDVHIEVKIMSYCYSQKKKMDTSFVINPWQQVSAFYNKRPIKIPEPFTPPAKGSNTLVDFVEELISEYPKKRQKKERIRLYTIYELKDWLPKYYERDY